MSSPGIYALVTRLVSIFTNEPYNLTFRTHSSGQQRSRIIFITYDLLTCPHVRRLAEARAVATCRMHPPATFPLTMLNP